VWVAYLGQFCELVAEHRVESYVALLKKFTPLSRFDIEKLLSIQLEQTRPPTGHTVHMYTYRNTEAAI